MPSPPHVRWLRKQLDEFDAAPEMAMRNAPLWREKVRLSRSVPMVTSVTVTTLLACVAVGMSVTPTPPHRSARAELPHEAPILDEWRQSEPRDTDEERAALGSTAPPIGSFAPSSGNVFGSGGLEPAATAALPACGTSRDCRRYPVRVVVEVALYDRFEPLARLRHRFVHALSELQFNLCQLRAQVLTNCVALYDIVPVPVLRADVCEAQEIERFRLPLSPSFPVLLGESPELNRARLFWVQSKSELCQPFPEFLQESVCFGPVLEPEHIVVRIAHHNDVAPRELPAPGVHLRGAAFRFNAKKLSRSGPTVRWRSKAVNFVPFLSRATLRTPANLWDTRASLCVEYVLG